MDTYIDNQDGTFSKQVVAPFDPKAVEQERDALMAQQAAAMDLASRNAQAQFQPQIDALQATLDEAAKQVPAIQAVLKP